MGETAIWWVRRDLRLGDNRALLAACEAGSVVPVFVLDEVFGDYGAAPLWRFGLGLEALDAALREKGSRLIFRRGDAAGQIERLVADIGAAAVHWSRAYDPDQVARDREVETRLESLGVAGCAHPGHVLFEPWTVETTQGDFYSVYSPFWRNVKDREVAPRQGAPATIPAPDDWPESEALADWKLDRPMRRGAEVVRPHLTIGEASASSRLAAFTGQKLESYVAARDRVDWDDGTSRLSENLSWGEISPASCWHAGMRARQEGKPGAETFLKELAWRDFAYHLAWHTPRLTHANWREKWDAFPWNEDEGDAAVTAWQRGRTGMPLIDAAMRELYVTGYMHNRARMNVASYLTKHLMSHWRIGQRWFEEHLIDWDPANNALGWQWAAGSGPDAAPYFRVFNPETQAEKHDPSGDYRARWIAEGQDDPPQTALAYFDAIPRSWGLSPDDPYPESPVVGAKEGRHRALGAYENRDF